MTTKKSDPKPFDPLTKRERERMNELIMKAGRVHPIRGEAVAMMPNPGPQVMRAVESEQDTEMTARKFKEIVGSLMGSGDIAPIIIARQKGKVHIAQAIEKDGVFVLPDMGRPSLGSLIKRKLQVRRIMKRLDPVLKRDIGEVTRIALMRKDEITLDKLEANLKKKDESHKPQIRNRIGCIFIEFGEDDIIQI